jgi:hypothetical protein
LRSVDHGVHITGMYDTERDCCPHRAGASDRPDPGPPNFLNGMESVKMHLIETEKVNVWRCRNAIWSLRCRIPASDCSDDCHTLQKVEYDVWYVNATFREDVAEILAKWRRLLVW